MTYLQLITVVHTAICFAAIGAGVVAVAGLFRGDGYPGWTRWFLILAAAVSITGYVFPFQGITPAVIVGVIALAVIALVLFALYRFRLAGRWREVYAAGLVASLYFLVFVSLAQAFQKIAPLNRLAPTQSEPPFAIVQGIALLLFLILGWRATRRFQPLAINRRKAEAEGFAP